MQSEQGYRRLAERDQHDRAVKKGKQVSYSKQLSESDKEQMKMMDTMRGFDPWTQTRLQHEICRGDLGDLNFIKARARPTRPGVANLFSHKASQPFPSLR